MVESEQPDLRTARDLHRHALVEGARGHDQLRRRRGGRATGGDGVAPVEVGREPPDQRHQHGQLAAVCVACVQQ